MPHLAQFELSFRWFVCKLNFLAGLGKLGKEFRKTSTDTSDATDV